MCVSDGAVDALHGKPRLSQKEIYPQPKKDGEATVIGRAGWIVVSSMYYAHRFWATLTLRSLCGFGHGQLWDPAP
jgi:hypothetical protein